MKRLHSEIKASLPVIFMKEQNSFIAYSPTLDLSTYGKTLEEAQENFDEALELFFDECKKMGTLEQVLESFGWVKNRKRKWLPPIFIGEKLVTIPDYTFA